jgi:hypothetical protein
MFREEIQRFPLCRIRQTDLLPFGRAFRKARALRLWRHENEFADEVLFEERHLGARNSM